ncbi:DNA/RNA nuclease SfsA [Clostridium kluyveri]|uniref:Sugar fermentation stimulation protein n=1 Tax=Clostridium kluyveri TaxID=1534 RepID=A0A1L5FAK8_CLOKL|nr:DNA/RNA nuclease SfsA [Clostridium kluyveri]APM39860.1 sugar fermentation stimulation protein [Clostridium kluyveri]
MKEYDFKFNEFLVEGVIMKRKGQFTMICEINDKINNCHCPTTGRIGNLDVSGLPCLLSKSSDPKRKTTYTVEAVSLDRPGGSSKSWIGINQNAVNRYVEHYLVNGGFKDMVGAENEVFREQFLGISKLDFLVGNTYLEVKTPLQHLQVEYPNYIKTKKVTPFSSTDRFVKHMIELGKSLQSRQRAILLICFIYDNPGFEVIEKSTNFEEVRAAVDKSITLGVEMWQANFEIQPEGVRLVRYFKR